MNRESNQNINQDDEPVKPDMMLYNEKVNYQQIFNQENKDNALNVIPNHLRVPNKGTIVL